MRYLLPILFLAFTVLADTPAPPAAKRNLSNLTSTAINTSLVPNANDSVHLGSSTFNFGDMYINNVNAPGADHSSISVVNRRLYNASSSLMFDWNGSVLDANTHKITNVVNPTSAQDVATKNFVESASTSGNAATATALSTNPSPCAGGMFVTDIAANGTLTCGTPAGGANVGLSNLVSPTLNATLHWDAHDTYLLGEAAASLQKIWSLRLESPEGLDLTADDDVNVYAGTGQAIRLNSDVIAGNINASLFTGPLTGTASVATRLAADPSACSAGQFASDIDDQGVLSCSTPAGTGATTSLNNIASTAFSANIIPDGNNTRNLGSAVNQIGNTYTLRTTSSYTGGYDMFTGLITGVISGKTGMGLVGSNSGSAIPDAFFLTTLDETGNNATNTQPITIDTGAKTHASSTGGTGAILIKTGTVAGSGTRGRISFQDGTQGTSGHVWTSDNTTGRGGWAAIGNAATATALAADPSACSAGQYVSDIAANGTLTCSAPSASVPISSSDMENCSIDGSVSSNILTVSILTAAGSTPSAGSPCLIAFRDTTATTSTYTQVSVTAATTTTVSSTSSLGCTASTQCEVFVYAINNGGTVEAGVTGVNLLDETAIQSSTAEGGAGAADSANTLYSTTARSSKAIRVMGRLRITPNGTFQWNANPTYKQNAPFPPSISNLATTSDSHQVEMGTTRHTWKWSTLDTGTGLKLQAGNSLTSAALLELDQQINGGGVSNTTMLITGTGSGSTCTSLKINNSCGSGGVTGSYGQQINMSGNNISPGLEINQSSANTGARGLKVNITGTTGTDYGIEVASSKTEPTTIGIYSSLTGASNSGRSIVATAASTSSSAKGGEFGLTSASATGYALYGYNAGTGGAGILGYATGSGARKVLELRNGVTAANNSAAAIVFNNNRTTGGVTDIAQVAGMITDVTNGSYKGALVFYTSDNAAPTEHMRLDYAGHMVFTGTAPAATSCGTSPSVAGNDVAGKVTIGTSNSSTCTLTFAKAYATAPACFVNDETTAVASKAISTTTTVIFTGTFTDSDVLSYHCVGY